MSKQKAASTSLYLPKYWPTWLGIFVLWLIARLPHHVALSIGERLGLLAMAVVPQRRHIAQRNIQLCFPHASEGEQTELVREHFKALGAGIIELAIAWWGNKEKLAQRFQYHGLENLIQAQQQGGVILLSAHFTTLEIAGFGLTLKAPAAGMFRPHKNAVIAWAMEHFRNEMAEKAIPRDDVRQMVKTLKNGGTVWYAADQSKRFKYTTIANFMGEPCVTNTATSRFAKLGKAQVVPFFMRRENGRYHLDILPPLENFPSGDESADAQRMNDLIATAVEKTPAQYFWTHKRFKGQRGKPSPY